MDRFAREYAAIRSRSPSPPRRTELDQTADMMAHFAEVSEISAHGGVALDDQGEFSLPSLEREPSITVLNLGENQPASAPVQQPPAPPQQGVVERLATVFLAPPNELRARVGAGLLLGGILEVVVGGTAGLLTFGPGLVAGAICLPGAVAGFVGTCLVALELRHDDPAAPGAPPPRGIAP